MFWSDQKKEKREALEFVNAIRAEFMAPPLEMLPKGSMSASRDCVIARAIKDGSGLDVLVNSHHVTVILPEGNREALVPNKVGNFIRAFDHCRYPELIAR